MKTSEKVYCAFCRTPRRIYGKKHVSWVNVLLSFFTAIFLMFAIWQTPDPRVLLFVVMGLIFSEIFVQMRWRISMICQYCGFDPLVYLKDHKAAAKKVKATLEAKASNPNLLLTRYNPFEYLPKREMSPQKPNKSLPDKEI